MKFNKIKFLLSTMAIPCSSVRFTHIEAKKAPVSQKTPLSSYCSPAGNKNILVDLHLKLALKVIEN